MIAPPLSRKWRRPSPHYSAQYGHRKLLKVSRKAVVMVSVAIYAGLFFWSPSGLLKLTAAAGPKPPEEEGGDSDAARGVRDGAAESSASGPPRLPPKSLALRASSSSTSRFPSSESKSKTGKKAAFHLPKLAAFDQAADPDMGRVTKHHHLQTFAELVRAIPKEGPLQDRVQMLVDAVQQCGIKAVAIDFDYTLLKIHTGGGWPESRLSELTAISPEVIPFLKELNKRSVSVHIVTFSDPSDSVPCLQRLGGEELIKAALSVNNNPFTVASIVALRPDLYTDPSRYKALGLEQPPPRSKAYHIDVVSRANNLSPWEVLLVDDDRVNCVQHLKAGGLALHVEGEGFSLDNIIAVTSPSLLG